jgi:hypothetical protein
MKPGDTVKLTESLSFEIACGPSEASSTTLDLDSGLTGIVVSKVGVHGFCRVQINICEGVHITTNLHKSTLEIIQRRET